MKRVKFNPEKDMKELEKYGFKLDDRGTQWQYICPSKDCYFITTYNREITILLQYREIPNEILILHYNLIKEGLLILEELEDER